MVGTDKAGSRPARAKQGFVLPCQGRMHSSTCMYPCAHLALPAAPACAKTGRKCTPILAPHFTFQSRTYRGKMTPFTLHATTYSASITCLRSCSVSCPILRINMLPLAANSTENGKPPLSLPRVRAKSVPVTPPSTTGNSNGSRCKN